MPQFSAGGSRQGVENGVGMGRDCALNTAHCEVRAPGERHSLMGLEQTRQSHLQQRERVSTGGILHQAAGQRPAFPLAWLEIQAGRASRPLYSFRDLGLARWRQVVDRTAPLYFEQSRTILEIGIAVATKGQQ